MENIPAPRWSSQGSEFNLTGGLSLGTTDPPGSQPNSAPSSPRRRGTGDGPALSRFRSVGATLDAPAGAASADAGAAGALVDGPTDGAEPPAAAPAIRKVRTAPEAGAGGPPDKPAPTVAADSAPGPVATAVPAPAAGDGASGSAVKDGERTGVEAVAAADSTPSEVVTAAPAAGDGASGSVLNGGEPAGAGTVGDSVPGAAEAVAAGAVAAGALKGRSRHRRGGRGMIRAEEKTEGVAGGVGRDDVVVEDVAVVVPEGGKMQSPFAAVAGNTADVPNGVHTDEPAAQQVATGSGPVSCASSKIGICF